MSKLLIGVIADQIYAHLDQKKFLPEEQKRHRKGFKGTTDLLYIDRAVIKEVKSSVWKSMEKWKVMLYSGNSELGEVEIKRGIF